MDVSNDVEQRSRDIRHRGTSNLLRKVQKPKQVSGTKHPKSSFYKNQHTYTSGNRAEMREGLEILFGGDWKYSGFFFFQFEWCFIGV